VKDRIEHSVSSLGMIGDAAKHLLKYFGEKEKPVKHKKHEDDEE
jgi:hypothetical protein